MEKLIHLENLQKKFDNVVILNNVQFTLFNNEIISLLGPSGSGKSTLIKTMLGMEKADGGTALILNSKMPNRLILGCIGYMAQSNALYELLTGYENLKFFGSLKGLTKKELSKDIKKVSAVVDLTAHLKKNVSTYSGGMKRRLSLAIALLGSPKLLVLDEPTVGIDPLLKKSIWNELIERKNNGTGILVTTHVMDEAELCDKVALIHDGKIAACDTPEKLKKQFNSTNIEEVFLNIEKGGNYAYSGNN
ncbi:ABC transporter, ATP-binding protein [Gemella bergeri ATCC 700627]|uniref:ABC transporter, ATP-binding protein n=1 Tax=Gemella bergeri ATCC 700627 TaxID=1321820 RepID=U2QJ34_9BACL|nr:ABC transporter ATP-binding protein [Gemella bergeri]ERK56471.1 ABC transporter, ATP-binding protein [Gemella bergeri ATCC 700627]